MITVKQCTKVDRDFHFDGKTIEGKFLVNNFIRRMESSFSPAQKKELSKKIREEKKTKGEFEINFFDFFVENYQKELINFVTDKIYLVSDGNQDIFIYKNDNSYTGTLWLYDGKEIGKSQFETRSEFEKQTYNWHTEMKEEYRGKGIGLKFYQMMIDFFETQNIDLIPSKELKPNSYRVWKKLAPDLVKYYNYYEKDERYKRFFAMENILLKSEKYTPTEISEIIFSEDWEKVLDIYFDILDIEYKNQIISFGKEKIIFENTKLNSYLSCLECTIDFDNVNYNIITEFYKKTRTNERNNTLFFICLPEKINKNTYSSFKTINKNLVQDFVFFEEEYFRDKHFFFKRNFISSVQKLKKKEVNFDIFDNAKISNDGLMTFHNEFIKCVNYVLSTKNNSVKKTISGLIPFVETQKILNYESTPEEKEHKIIEFLPQYLEKVKLEEEDFIEELINKNTQSFQI